MHQDVRRKTTRRPFTVSSASITPATTANQERLRVRAFLKSRIWLPAFGWSPDNLPLSRSIRCTESASSIVRGPLSGFQERQRRDFRNTSFGISGTLQSWDFRNKPSGFQERSDPAKPCKVTRFPLRNHT